MLTMLEYLEAVDAHGITAADVLSESHHPKVILAKAEKAARKGYTDYGVNVWRAWIEQPGRDFIEAHRA